MFSLCVNPPPASDAAASSSLRQPAFPRLIRDALRRPHHSMRRSFRDLLLRRPRPPPPPTALYARHGVCLAPTKRPSTCSLIPNAPKSACVDTSCSDGSHPYARSHISSATSLSSCTDRDHIQCAPSPSCSPSRSRARPHHATPPKCAVPPLDDRWLSCSTDSFPTVVSAEPLSDRPAHSATDSPRSPRSVLRLLTKLPDVRDSTTLPLSAAAEHSQPSEQRASMLPERAECATPPRSEQHKCSREPSPEARITVPIVATYPEDRQETRSNAISLFGMFAPAGLPHGDHQTQANAYAVLAAYAENDQEEEEALGDMDLSAVDHLQPLQAQTDAQLPVMHMDAETYKWVGNEQQFAHFDSIAAAVCDDPQPAVRDAVFDVHEQLFQQWRQDGEQHNRQFAHGFQESATPDIRDMIAVFTEARAPSSQQQQQSPPPP